MIPGLDVKQAKRYSRIRLGVLLASLVWSVLRLTWFAGSGRSARLRDGVRTRVPDRRLSAPLHFGIAFGLSWLSHLPLAYVGGYRVERAFGLTKQSMGGWLADQVKGLAVAQALEVPLVSGAYAVIRRRPNDWWLILSGATVPLLVVMQNLAPVLIMPLFNRFEPLRDRELAGRVKRLAETAGVSIADVFQMDMSRQSEKANAFFTGVGNTKRIVLGDTLIEQFTPEEVEGVVAHELGHQVHGDVWRLVALGAATGFGGAYAAYRTMPPLLNKTAWRTGVGEVGDEASLPLLVLVMTLIGFLTAPLQSAISRAIERRTDRYAMELTGDGEAYASAMARLGSRNLADPDPPAAVVFFLYTHPPIAERIAAAKAFARARAAVDEL
jgi:STE24 endopeptidase